MEIRVVSSPPMRSVIHVLGPQFEKVNGLKLVAKIASVMHLKHQIDAGDRFDVAILTPELIGALVKDGKIVADARANIARSGLGVAVRAGRRRPEVGSTDTLKRALLAAKSVIYASGSAVTRHVEHMFERLGIVEDMKSRSMLQPAGGHIGKAIAEGVAELGLTHIPVILEATGAALAGPFPAELQFYVDLSAGVSAGSMEPERAKALIRFLLAPEATTVIKAKGLERVSP